MWERANVERSVDIDAGWLLRPRARRPMVVCRAFGKYRYEHRTARSSLAVHRRPQQHPFVLLLCDQAARRTASSRPLRPQRLDASGVGARWRIGSKFRFFGGRHPRHGGHFRDDGSGFRFEVAEARRLPLRFERR